MFVETKEQVDYFYHLPAHEDEAGVKRLKLRTEKGSQHFIHYCDRQEEGARTSTFQMWSVNDSRLSDVLKAALGIQAIVRKRRELWHKDNVIFNLDNVDGVGQILEVEVQDKEGMDIESQIQEYRSIFEPFLGDFICGSNEDLVIAEGA